MNKIKCDKFTSVKLKVLVSALGFGVSSLSYAADFPAGTTDYTCDVAIIGGGPAGIHTAYKLTTMGLVSGKVCLFEKSDHLGGRVGNNEMVGQTSTPFSYTKADGATQTLLKSGQVGTGGYRMYFNHYAYTLGQELIAKGNPGELAIVSQISFNRLQGIQKNSFFSSKYQEPTYFTYDNFGKAKAFAPIYNSPINNNDIWKALLCGIQVPKNANNFPQYRQMKIPGIGSMSSYDYLQWVAQNVIAKQNNGPQIAQYLLDTWRFRADFLGKNLDAIAYLEYNANDFLGGATRYPIPSFQPYFDIMEREINKTPIGIISKNNQVLSVNYANSSSSTKYVLTTSKGIIVHANQVIIATPDKSLKQPNGITGDVISQIVNNPNFTYTRGADTVTVTHQFGDGVNPNTGWWNPSSNIAYSGAGTLLLDKNDASSNPIRRSNNNIMIKGDLVENCTAAKCDFTNTYFYNNTNELPLTPYHDWINTSRSVYNDDGPIVKNWLDLYNAGGTTAVNKQVLKSLRVMYPSVFTGSNEPAILKTQVTFHLPGWYNLGKGAFAAGVTNESILKWSQDPIPNESVYLIGDAWNPVISGWSEAAYYTSVKLLNEKFGAQIAPKQVGSIQCVNGDIVDPSGKSTSGQ